MADPKTTVPTGTVPPEWTPDGSWHWLVGGKPHRERFQWNGSAWLHPWGLEKAYPDFSPREMAASGWRYESECEGDSDAI